MEKRIRNWSLKTKLYISVFVVMLVLIIFAIFAFASVIRSYNEHYYALLSDIMSFATGSITAQLDTVEKTSVDIIVDDSIQKTLSDLKDSGNPIRGTKVTSFQYFLSQLAKRFSSLNTLVIVPFDRSACIIQSRANNLSSDDYLEISYKLENSNMQSMWITDYSPSSRLVYATKINRKENISLDTLGYFMVDINLPSLFEDVYLEQSATSFSFSMYDEEYKRIYGTTSSGYDDSALLKRAKQKDRFSIQKLGLDYFFVLAQEYGEWYFMCSTQYTKLMGWIRNLISLFITIAIFLIVLMVVIETGIYNSIYQEIDSLRYKFLKFSGEDIDVPMKDYSERSDELGVLHQQFDMMVERVEKLTEAKIEAETSRKKAIIEMLQTQINPHFVFNVLQLLNWRAKKARDKNLSLMIESLGRILQVSLSKDVLIYLDSEINLVDEYIIIQKLRNPDIDIELSKKIDNELIDFLLPKLSIEPLIENAIAYSSPKDNAISIDIAAHLVNDKVVVSVSNTGSCFEDNLLDKLASGAVKPHGHGIGLVNISRRLEYFYGKQYGLMLKNEDGRAVVSFQLPYKKD